MKTKHGSNDSCSVKIALLYIIIESICLCDADTDSSFVSYYKLRYWPGTSKKS